MGIPLYFHTITQAYPGILHLAKPKAPHYFFLDFNGAIHHAVKKVIDASPAPPAAEDLQAFERTMYDEIWKYTLQCCDVAKPSEHVGIYIDGVAPVAKMNQQRKRRYMSIFRHKLMGTVPIWDTNAISPGTGFMTRLHAYLRTKIREDIAYAGLYKLSSSEEPGEGEHKIFAHIATIPAQKTVFIHGLDADLIMLSLMSHHPNIILMREPSWPYTPESTEDGFLYLEIDKLRTGILAHLRDTYGWSVPDTAISDSYCPDAQHIIETYVVCCFLLGNDFLPHPPTLSLKKKGYERLLHVAREAWVQEPTGAVSGTTVNMNFITQILQRLAKTEDEDMWHVNQDYMKRHPNPNATIKDPADSYPVRDENKDPLAAEIYNSSQPKRWRALYYQRLFHCQLYDTRVVAKACRMYAEGICWVYCYYKRLPKPSDWCYHYSYPPSLLDMANFLQGTPDNVWESMQKYWREQFITPQFVEPAIQLLCILPKESAHLLPYKYQRLVSDHSLGMTYMFPASFPVQTYLCTHLWECTPVLSPIDIPWIIACLRGNHSRHQGK